MKRTMNIINARTAWAIGLIIGIVVCATMGFGSSSTPAADVTEAASDRNAELAQIQAYLGR